ncbi:MAG TPA: hypothetical protein VLX59_01135 [Acidimicrobiales bacterium]|nr:hypothetical protein [Acidimicrobiales bacterium]
MYVFNRSGRLTGANEREAMPWAVAIGEKVAQVTGLQVSLYSRVFSAEVGTLVWATTAPDLATLEAAFDKLMPDDGYQEMAQTGLKYMDPSSFHDRLEQVVHPADLDTDRQHEYVSLVRSTINGGQLARGVAAGVEIAQLFEQITGIPAVFMVQETGNFGEVSWAVTYADIRELQRSGEATNADPRFVGLLDSLAGVYTDTPGASTQVIMRRVA